MTPRHSPEARAKQAASLRAWHARRKAECQDQATMDFLASMTPVTQEATQEFRGPLFRCPRCHALSAPLTKAQLEGQELIRCTSCGRVHYVGST